MLDKLFNMIKAAINSMVAYKDISDVVKVENTINSKMRNKLKSWKRVYTKQINTINTAKTACEIMCMTMLNEFSIEINNEEIQKQINLHLIPELSNKIEYALAMGGCIIKPYIKNKQIYFDFCSQGEFYPIAYDNDGNLTDVAFIDQFVKGGWVYTLIERQTFNNNTVIVENKAFQNKYQQTDDPIYTELGKEIKLEDINRWAEITPVIKIENVKKPLFGYYKVAQTNNIDVKCPMGISFFNSAMWLCKKADEQFKRLDWEYEGGQLAIDVDPSALKYTKQQELQTYFGHAVHLPQNKERIFRQLDMGEDDTYKPYAPNLRDADYIQGLNKYFMMIEDKIGLARGSLSEVTDTARTATEIRVLKQRAYNTAEKNQNNLRICLEDLVAAIVAYANLYQIQNINNYELVVNFGDSVLVDKDSEIPMRLQLVNNNIISKAEFRAWYTGESLQTAEEEIQKIIDTNKANFGNDIFSGVTKEDKGDADEDSQ